MADNPYNPTESSDEENYDRFPIGCGDTQGEIERGHEAPIPVTASSPYREARLKDRVLAEEIMTLLAGEDDGEGNCHRFPIR